MFNFFHSFVAKIVVAFSSIALLFFGATANPGPTPQPITQDPTLSVQVKIDTTTTTAPASMRTRNTSVNTQKITQKNQTLPVQQTVEAQKTSIVTLPSGAIVEMDTNGNVIRVIQEAPQQTYNAPTYVSPAPQPSQPSSPTPAPTKITIQSSASSNSYIANGVLESFYDITSDANTEIDLTKMDAKLNGIQKSGYDSVEVLFTDETHNMTLYRADLTNYLSPTYNSLEINATFSQPLVIRRGYPTKIDIQVRGVGIAKQPTIEISSIDSGYIVNTGGTVYLFKPTN